MASYTKEPPNCQSDILFIGTTGLRSLAGHPDVEEMYIDLLVPENFGTTDFKEVALYIEVLTAGVNIVPNPVHDTRGEWAIGKNGTWVVTEPSRPATDRLRLKQFNQHLNSGGINGLSIYLGVTGLPANGAMEFYAYGDAQYVTAVVQTKSCKIHMSDFHDGQQLAGFH
ncbi:hypothetical protein [Streptomyces hokutonensis]|uniref:hypothetical protein n=1 Tax=Streptomyces hokutonensis TaxID=1306990 RepID=UPI0036874B1D